jgi:hypothetical protein
LLDISAATIDRLLRPVREASGRIRRRRWGLGSAIRQSVPIRTFNDWGEPPPGYCEADLVEHCGREHEGSFVHSLTLTDIHSGWTECAALVIREQTLVVEGISLIRHQLPFALRGLDTDNDSVFMNETLQNYCREHQLEWTRSRAYRKNDQAWVEQKNGAVVRRTVGYRRFEGLEAAAVLARLYAAMRLFVNFFQPSFKLAAKARDGAKVRKRYHPPATPCQRLLADARTSQEVRRRLNELRATLDPVRLLREVRVAQQQLVEIADTPVIGDAAKPTPPTLEQFLSGLRTAWQEGEVRPTSVPKAKPKRLRRRPDPLAAVTTELRGWFEAEPWRTSRELFERLQAVYPGVYPDGQLRTLQRRVKEWRREVAYQMVFGTTLIDPGLAVSGAECSSGDASGEQCPVDLPLRLDDAGASPTTPQVPPQHTSM